MNFYFFHIGELTNIQTMMVDSIRITNPDSRIIQVTDHHTLKLEKVDKCLRFDGSKDNIMKFRFDAYSNILYEKNSENIFLDTDMLVLKKLSSQDIFKKSDIVFCKREFNTESMVNINLHNLNMKEYINKTLLQAWPFMGCFIASKNNNLFTEMNDMYDLLENKYKFWYGDQIILKKYYEKFSSKIDLVGEAKYANVTLRIDDNSDVRIMHFKGMKKKHMLNFYLNYFNLN